ncbi:MAG: hypothetical protein QM764_15435 [Chitinophagaceae bacterium]
MKNSRLLIVLFGLMIMVSSCKAWNSVFGPKYGCPTNGKNVGAEKLASGDPEAERAARKAKKFRS